MSKQTFSPTRRANETIAFFSPQKRISRSYRRASLTASSFGGDACRSDSGKIVVTRPPVRVLASCLRLPRAAHHSMCMEITQLLFFRASAISERMSSPRLSLHRSLLFFRPSRFPLYQSVVVVVLVVAFPLIWPCFPMSIAVGVGTYGSSFQPGRCVLIFLAFSGMWVAGRFGFV